MLKGPDVSAYQGDIDFPKLVADFIIFKATEGVGFRDSKLSRNQIEGRKRGLPIGYYHFARPDLGNSPEAEAQYFLDQLGPLREGEMLFLDFEVTFNNRVAWCKAWLDHVASKTAVKAPIYLNQALLKGANWKPLVDAGYGLWLAVYDGNPNSTNLPSASPWPFMAFRQFESNVNFVGISDPTVDGNVFYGDLAALKAYGYKAVTSIADCMKLSDDIPGLVEEKYKLKDFEWYDKHWTLDEFIKDSIETHGENKTYESVVTTMKKNLETTTTNYNIALGVIEAKKKDIERLQLQKYKVSEAINFLVDAIKNGRY